MSEASEGDIHLRDMIWELRSCTNEMDAVVKKNKEREAQHIKCLDLKISITPIQVVSKCETQTSCYYI